MCTVTWFREPAGYQLFFNRDELKTRRPAHPPEVRRGGVRNFVAPTDGDHGGTWIAANPAGLTLCLLNGYRAADDRQAPAGGGVSRGLLVTSLADAASPAEVLARTRAAHLERFRSFRLLVLGPMQTPRFARWQDGVLDCGELHEDALPVVSSSFAPDEVAASRRAAFKALAPRRGEDAVSAHLEFHRGHGGTEEDHPGPHSVCMHREDAETVSFSRVVVDDRSVRFFYAPHAPHLGIPDTPAVTLERPD